MIAHEDHFQVAASAVRQLHALRSVEERVGAWYQARMMSIKKQRERLEAEVEAEARAFRIDTGMSEVPIPGAQVSARRKSTHIERNDPELEAWACSVGLDTKYRKPLKPQPTPGLDLQRLVREELRFDEGRPGDVVVAKWQGKPVPFARKIHPAETDITVKITLSSEIEGGEDVA